MKNALDFKISSFSYGNGSKIERYDDIYEFCFLDLMKNH